MTLYPARVACNLIVAFSVELMDVLMGPKIMAKYGEMRCTRSRASRMYAERSGVLELCSLLKINACALHKDEKALRLVNSLTFTRCPIVGEVLVEEAGAVALSKAWPSLHDVELL